MTIKKEDEKNDPVNSSGCNCRNDYGCNFLLPEANHSGNILNSGANSQIELNLWLHSLCKMHTKPKGIVPVKNEPGDFGLWLFVCFKIEKVVSHILRRVTAFQIVQWSQELAASCAGVRYLGPLNH